MFLDKKYILANELVEKMGIHIANISMLRKLFEHNGNTYDMVKRNNCTFINTKSRHLPNNIMKGINSNILTDMSDKLPRTYVVSEFGITEHELQKSGILKEKIKISSKDFYVFQPDFVKEIKGKIPYILDREETLQCFKNKDILGYIELSKNKFLTWY